MPFLAMESGELHPKFCRPNLGVQIVERLSIVLRKLRHTMGPPQSVALLFACQVRGYSSATTSVVRKVQPSH